MVGIQERRLRIQPCAAMRDGQSDDSSSQARCRGRPVRQIELCDRHAEMVIARERACGLEILDRRDWRY
jgi:hypothetical protein